MHLQTPCSCRNTTRYLPGRAALTMPYVWVSAGVRPLSAGFTERHTAAEKQWRKRAGKPKPGSLRRKEVGLASWAFGDPQLAAAVAVGVSARVTPTPAVAVSAASPAAAEAEAKTDLLIDAMEVKESDGEYSDDDFDDEADSAGGSDESEPDPVDEEARVAVGETVVLLDLPPLLVGFSVGMARERQQNDSLADG